VAVKLPKGITGNKIRPLVANKNIIVKISDRWCHFVVASILDHEVIVIS
jgi:hypothetical protein